MRTATKRLRLMSLACAGLLLAAPAFAETWTHYRTCENSRSEVLIEGTSTMHPWTVRGRSIEGEVRIAEDFLLKANGEDRRQARQRARGDEQSLPVQAELAVRSETLRSFRDGRPYSDRMDNIMYEKLRVDEYPEIVYKLESLDWDETGSENEEKVLLVADGELTVAGVAGRLSMPVEMTRVDSGRLRFSGEVDFKMTDFEIDPPRALAGMIRTGDEITVRVEWVVVEED